LKKTRPARLWLSKFQCTLTIKAFLKKRGRLTRLQAARKRTRGMLGHGALVY